MVPEPVRVRRDPRLLARRGRAGRSRWQSSVRAEPQLRPARLGVAGTHPGATSAKPRTLPAPSRSSASPRAVNACASLVAGSVSLTPCPLGAPQSPHNSAPAPGGTHNNPRTKRHYPAHGGTSANVALLALASLYAGSAGLTPSAALVARAATGLLLTGRFMVRVHAREPARVSIASPLTCDNAGIE
jgi:hypothetical protein